MDKAFKILLEQINSNIKILNENGFKMYDAENLDWYMKSVEYDKEKDLLLFNVKEDK